MHKLIHAIISAIKAEARLQDELSKRYPFGHCEPCLIDLCARDYRRCHTVKSYLAVPELDRYGFAQIGHAPKHQYTGAYGCFGSYIGHIVCQVGTDCVYAHNPEEAKELLLTSESQKYMHDDEWLLTDFGVYNADGKYEPIAA